MAQAILFRNKKIVFCFLSRYNLEFEQKNPFSSRQGIETAASKNDYNLTYLN